MEARLLINIAEYYHKTGAAVPVDVQARLLEAGIDVQKYQQTKG